VTVKKTDPSRIVYDINLLVMGREESQNMLECAKDSILIARTWDSGVPLTPGPHWTASRHDKLLDDTADQGSMLDDRFGRLRKLIFKLCESDRRQPRDFPHVHQAINKFIRQTIERQMTPTSQPRQQARQTKP